MTFYTVSFWRLLYINNTYMVCDLFGQILQLQKPMVPGVQHLDVQMGTKKGSLKTSDGNCSHVVNQYQSVPYIIQF